MSVTHQKEAGLFESHLASRGLRRSRQRKTILEAFLRSEKHLTAEELYSLVKGKNPEIGFATVYRTIRLLCECGLGREARFGDGPARYEHLYGHRHHDHLVCTECGALTEVVDPGIEALQNKLFKTHGFIPRGHRMELYGVCGKCRGRR